MNSERLNRSVDAAVVGGGPAGLTTAIGLARAGLQTLLIAPPAPVDPRTTALLGASVELLEDYGVWSHVAEIAAPLSVMRLIDDTGRLVRAPEVAFDARELDLPTFGYNVLNDALNNALDAVAASTPGLTRLMAKATAVHPGPDAVVIDTDAGPVTARVAVAADGSRSLARTAAGIDLRTWSYPQSALVTTFSHERPHLDESVEFHRPAGPFTVVPLKGNRSSLVWVETPDEARRLADLPKAELEAEIETVSHGLLGPVVIDGPVATIPLGGHVAKSFGARRVALVGEAAHRFPPIGAQGLNLSLRDVRDLVATLKDAHARGEDPGSDATLAAYHGRRRVDVVSRTLGVHALDKSLLSGFLPVQVARGLGLTLAANVGTIRRFMMRRGLGEGLRRKIANG
ncbi:UbiH/UbiF family hydroxylase [Segnochrobactraceae bacterium EtOH-i3]